MFKRIRQLAEKKVLETLSADFIPRPFSFEGLLVLLSKMYRAIVIARLKAFESGMLKTAKVPCPVISVGNVTVGGMGKTPMTVYIAKLLEKAGKKPLVLSRGYKGTYKSRTAVVSDGRKIFMHSSEAGDEPFMMANTLNCPVMVARDRAEGAAAAWEKFKPDAVILDDAFQHLRLSRDLDILLCDFEKPLGNNRLLPAGKLREPFEKAVKRADIIVLTRSPCLELSAEPKSPQAISRLLSDRPVFFTAHAPYLYLHQLSQKKAEESCVSEGLELLANQTCVAFSGLADNKGFKTSLEKLSIATIEHLEFPDHYRYKEADILMVQQAAEALAADWIVTTEKDYAKIPPGIEWQGNFAVIGVKIVFVNNENKFGSLIQEQVKV
ncbi:MAG: tetraacyldisaccharide 4'-kinase [Desulfarculaceae bacterium]|nr:tetraacyldisaccharide 4'-kinase [Desulfarculaceae bacterium]